jgi:DNA-binding response OmpR family regulator
VVFSMAERARAVLNSDTAASGLDGTRVLVVEDESLIAMFIEDTLADIGCEAVYIASSLDDAMNKVTEIEHDIVMLDVNLAGKDTFSLAEVMSKKNQPFIFSTGYGNSAIPSHLKHVPVLQKPFREGELEEKLKAALAMGRS